MSQLVDAVVKVEALRAEAMVYRSRPITQFDIGGGLPVPYSENDNPPELVDYTSRLAEKVPTLFAQDTRVLTEFGRSIHAGCGWAISRVEYLKHEVTGKLDELES